ncbi:MAG: 30S ribosomal protein S3 [Anaerolineae bacterium]|nr:30S ribosomal protein S3 [Anaerolineae bacterium]MDW8100110.1 30S ribosomal protein S3 [Anaerolineae bacterium]
MGRKVHPIGFRLGIIKDWETRWYAEGSEYADLLTEDRQIRQTIRQEMEQAGISRIEIERFPGVVQIMIHTSKPGIIIGRKGASVNTLRAKLQELTGKKVKLDVVEIEKPELDAYLVAEDLADQLERRVSYKRAMKQAVARAMRAGAKGIMITVSGRLAGSEMARADTVREGRVPRHTLRADIDFARAEALTTYGRIGVKVWIYKGDVMPQRQETSL